MRTSLEPVTAAERSAIAAVGQKLPPFPRVLIKVINLLSKEDTDFRELSELIRSDAAFSRQILTVANSPLFALGRPIAGVLQALGMLGVDRVKSLAFTVAIQGYVAPCLRFPAIRRCWRHSLATAIIAESLSKGALLDPDRSFTAGVLHEVGRLMLIVHFNRQYGKLLEENSLPREALRRTEQEIFGFDHRHFGCWLIKSWHLSDEFCEILLNHDEPFAGTQLGLPDVVSIASRMAEVLGFYGIPPAEGDTWESLIEEIPAADWARLRWEAPALLHTVSTAINSIEATV